MALIRQSQASRVTRDAVVLDLGDLALQGARCRERAVADAAAVLSEARLERERMLRDAATEGFERGVREGREQGLTEGREQGRGQALAEHGASMDALQRGWAAALDGFVAQREALMSDARQDVLRLAVLIAERVTRLTVENRPDAVAAQLQSVLQQLSRRTRLRIRVHPEDEAIAREAAPALLAKTRCVEHVEWETDTRLERGSCVADSAGGGEIDASILTQLDRIARVLLPGDGEREAAGAGDRA